MVRYLCCSDLHLGAGADLGNTPTERLAEQEETLAKIVDLAANESVAAILFAGDLFEGPQVPPEQYAIVQRQMRRSPCPVVAITGNGRHDAAMRDVTAPEVLGDVADVRTAPGTVLLPGGVMLAVLPWVSVARPVASQDGQVERDEVNALAADLLLETASGLARECAGYPRILMTHFAISGDQDGISEFAREPVLPLADLEQLDFDAIVAGHYHRSQLLATNPADPVMPIFYCGSPMPLNFGEGGYDHGVWLLDTHEHGIVPEFVPLTSRPFVTLDWDFADGEDFSQLLEGYDVWDPEVAASSPVAGAFVKARYTADEETARRIDHEEVRRALELSGAHRVWVEPSVVRARRERGAAIDTAGSRIDQLASYLSATDANGNTAALIAAAERYLA